jgi:hypothetical protein
VIVCSIVASTLACDFVAIHRGRVVACGSNQPIEGAVVQLTDSGDASRHTLAETKPDGTYVVAVPGNNDMHQLVAASGYRADERDLPRAPDDVATDVCLSPDAPRPAK